MSTSVQGMIDRLIATYRNLNEDIRPLARESELPNQAYVLLAKLRDDELRVAQTIKEGLTGVRSPELTNSAPVIGTETGHDPIPVIISQFGTARETTLSLVRELSEADWSKALEVGGSVSERIQAVVDNDARQMKALYELVGLPVR